MSDPLLAFGMIGVYPPAPEWRRPAGVNLASSYDTAVLLEATLRRPQSYAEFLRAEAGRRIIRSG